MPIYSKIGGGACRSAHPGELVTYSRSYLLTKGVEPLPYSLPRTFIAKIEDEVVVQLAQVSWRFPSEATLVAQASWLLLVEASW